MSQSDKIKNRLISGKHNIQYIRDYSSTVLGGNFHFSIILKDIFGYHFHESKTDVLWGRLKQSVSNVQFIKQEKAINTWSVLCLLSLVKDILLFRKICWHSRWHTHDFPTFWVTVLGPTWPAAAWTLEQKPPPSHWCRNYAKQWWTRSNRKSWWSTCLTYSCNSCFVTPSRNIYTSFNTFCHTML